MHSNALTVISIFVEKLWLTFICAHTGKANEVAGQAKGKAEEVKGKL